MKIKKVIIVVLLLFILVYVLCNLLITDKEVQVFYISSDTDEYTKLRYDLLTTIVYAKVDINRNGSLTPSENYDPSPVISYAHNKKVKVVLMFQGEDDISKDIILENQTVRTMAINNLLDEVKKYNFDGIDIDLESLNVKNSINGQPNEQLMTDFVTVLSDKFKETNPNYRISIDISSYYKDVDKIFNLTILQNKVSFVMMMGYDQYGPWSSNAGPNAPINLDDGRGIYDSVNHYKMLMDRKKILLGVPWYGFKFATVNNTRLSPVNGDVKYISYKDYIKVIDENGRKWDDIWQTSWYVRKDDDSSQWYQFHYDDVRSLGIKYDLVTSEGLGGIGIWAVNYGVDAPELWQLIKVKFVSNWMS